jgi:hypothetical protein
MPEETLESNISYKNMRAEKSYAFFSQAEETGLPFTIEDICKASSYTKETADGYYQKKWYWFIRKDGETYYCEGLHRCPKGNKKNKRSKEIWYTPKTDDLEEKDGTDRGSEGAVDQDSRATQRKCASSVSGTHGESPGPRWGQPS